MAVVLVLDLGTTILKATLFDEGRMLGVVRRATPLQRRLPDRCEIDPAEFRRWIGDALAELRAALPSEMARIKAVTFATQTNSFILLDADDRPLTPLILWSDTRATDDNRAISQMGAPGDFRRTTGIPALSAEFAVAKLRWLARHEPETFASAARFCLISDFLTLWLTGEHVTEASVSGLTGLLDIHNLNWWSPACDAAGIPIGLLPAIVRAGTDLGVIHPTAAAELGLPHGCRLIAGCLDQFAGAIGAGCVEDGMICETTGTVLSTVRCRKASKQPTPPGVFEGPGFDPGTMFQMNFGSTSANLLDQYRGTLAGNPSLAELDLAVEREYLGAQGLVMPWPTEVPTQTWIARMAATEAPARVVRAIMETVAIALRQQVNALASPGEVLELRSAGGGARSDVWLQIKADLLGISVLASGCPEPTSLGAAMLAARTLGEGSIKDLARHWCVPRRRFAPDPRRHEQYAASLRASE